MNSPNNDPLGLGLPVVTSADNGEPTSEVPTNPLSPSSESQESGETPNQCVTASFFYDSGRKEYLLKNSGGRWFPNTETQFKRKLRSMGLSSKVPEGANISPIEVELLRLQDENDISFAGTLAGHAEGFYELNGSRFVVTESPKLINPQTGEWPVLRALLGGLFGNDHEQVTVFMAWMKFGIAALRTFTRQPGQALVLAGPAGCGKSLLQGLITEMLGGRSAKAAMYLTGRTDFNAELFGAEHLVLEDEFMSTRISDRQRLGAGIKALAVNEFHPCHRKRQTIVNLRPLWRTSISVNDDPEALLVLPPMDDHLRDKFVLLRCDKAALPMPTTTAADQKRFRETLSTELPAFLAAINEMDIPKDLRCERYGVTSYHNEQLAHDLDLLSPESQLLELIDAAADSLFGMADDQWNGTAAELKHALLECSATQREARSLLEWRNAAGTYLGRLAKKHPIRIQPKRNADSRTWIIHRKPMTP